MSRNQRLLAIVGHLACGPAARSAAREFARSGVIGLQADRAMAAASVRSPVPDRPGEMVWPGIGPMMGESGGGLLTAPRPNDGDDRGRI